MFSDVIEIIETNGKSIHAYNDVAGMLRRNAASQPEDAAGYLVLALAAEQFLELNERMPLRAPQVAESFDRIKSFAESLDQGRAAGREAYLGAIESVAHQIASA
ncbi:hypothetical protein [Paracoccus sediminicola]|uniref:hypothetical protein n=1 Tax=Paracoccus sediminicola TaxID=3017783 RepID=UPI0022EFEDBB|nr:hypothetical protein [Paracoccus sediminicola]WBU56122.1 hypothetical protein PAF18_11550 [Paracoccus sediminicola]